MNTVANIGAAIVQTVDRLWQLKTKQDIELTKISTEHQQVMERLRVELISEENRHEAFMKLLNLLEKALSMLSDEIKTAKCDECEGLPGICRSNYPICRSNYPRFEFIYFKLSSVLSAKIML